MYMYVLVTCNIQYVITHQVLHEEDEKKRVHQMEQQRQSV